MAPKIMAPKILATTIMTDEKDRLVQDKATAETRGRETSGRNIKPPAEFPPEGPHARADLINEDATPGTGLFSGGQKSADKDVDPGAG